MLRSCPYCGRIHDKKYICSKKTIRKKYGTEQNRFRSKNVWTKKAKEIKERDGFLCQICMKKLFETVRQFNSQELEVHHIVPLAEDYDLRLENENLITLCVRHHKMADDGIIPASLLMEIAKENEENGCQALVEIPPLGVRSEKSETSKTTRPPFFTKYSQNENEMKIAERRG